MNQASNEDQQGDERDGQEWMDEARRVLDELERERSKESKESEDAPRSDIQRALA